MTEVAQALYTIGFTQKSAETFFSLLKKNQVNRIVDTRLNNTGQLAGFSKKEDLKYFARTILGVDYVHWEESAPEKPMLDAYKKKVMKWDQYAREYEALLQRRKIQSQMELIVGASGCLLCSEAKPHHCHRSLLADYLSRTSGRNISVKHIL